MRFEWSNDSGRVDGPLVYVAYAAETVRPLYVGVTEELVNRLAQHRNGKPRKPWYFDIDRVVITTFPTRAEAEAHERVLIQTLEPIHNLVRYYETAGV